MHYSDTKQLGAYAIKRKMRFKPIQSGEKYPDDYIRIPIRQRGYLDPHSAYIKITVELIDPTPKAMTFYNLQNSIQLDGSAQSLIAQWRITHEGKELEYIEEYDVLSDVLDSFWMSAEKRAQHLEEGYGTLGANIRTNQKLSLDRIDLDPYNIPMGTIRQASSRFPAVANDFSL